MTAAAKGNPHTLLVQVMRWLIEQGCDPQEPDTPKVALDAADDLMAALGVPSDRADMRALLDELTAEDDPDHRRATPQRPRHLTAVTAGPRAHE